MKLVLITGLLSLFLTIQAKAQFQYLATLPTDHPVNDSIVMPDAMVESLFEDYCKNNLFKNLDNLLHGDTIFIKQSQEAYNNSGSIGSIIRKYYKVTFAKKNGIADGLFEIDYLYESRSPSSFFRESSNPAIVLDSLPAITVITGNYKDGEKQGIWTFYDLDGELIAQGELQGNNQVGNWLEKRREIFISQASIINHGNIETSKVYYLESHYTQNGLRNGKSTGYQTQAKETKMIEIDYQNGLKNGTRIMYYPDGKLHIKADFAQGKRNGLYEAWAKNGKKIMETSFKDDLFHGKFTKWTATGKVHYAGKYIDGKMEGDWIYYDIKDNLRWERRFENGKKIGEWSYCNNEPAKSPK